MRKGRLMPGYLCMLLAAATAATLPACTSKSTEPAPTPAARVEAVSPAPVEITFVDIDGFLLTSDGTKVLVDAFTDMAPRAVRTLLEEAQPPFDDVDLILTTHIHSDHFDADMVGAHMERCPDALFVSTQAAVDRLRAAFPGVAEERLHAFEPDEGQRLQTRLRGVDLEILNLPHGVPVTNLAFVIHIGGKKLLHTGDLVDPADVAAYGLAAEDIDVALVPYFFLVQEDLLTEDGRSELLEAIRAKHVVPMHLSLMEYGREGMVDELAAVCPGCILFREGLETHLIE